MLPKLNWGAWFYGLWVSVIGGAASAVTSTFAVSMYDPAKYNLANGMHDVVKLMLTIFLVNALFLFFTYLAKHPAPEWNGETDRRSGQQANGAAAGGDQTKP